MAAARRLVVGRHTGLAAKDRRIFFSVLMALMICSGQMLAILHSSAHHSLDLATQLPSCPLCDVLTTGGAPPATTRASIVSNEPPPPLALALPSVLALSFWWMCPPSCGPPALSKRSFNRNAVHPMAAASLLFKGIHHV